MKMKLLMGAAIVSLCSANAWGQAAPTSDEDPARDVVVIIGQGETRQVQTLTAADLELEAAGSSPIKLIESLPGAFFVFTVAGEMLRWNARLQAATGYSSLEIAALRPQKKRPVVSGASRSRSTRRTSRATTPRR